MTKVAIYSRLSQDRDGTKTSTARQEADCRALAKARGWKVVEVYRDNNMSGYSGKERPAFERMVSDLHAKRFDGIVSWKVDRLGRRTADVVRLIEQVDALGGFVCTNDGLDSRTPMGRGVLEIAAVFASMESSNNAARVRRAKLQIAQDGRPSGGGRRPFGYTADGMEVIEAEASWIRKLARSALDGRSLRAMTRDLNEAGVKSSGDSAWHGVQVRRMLISPRIAGLRVYRGEVIGQASWPAIITLDEHEQLVAKLTDPNRQTTRPGARRYLLTGITFCERCGSPLVAAPAKGKRAYACRSQRRGGGCGGVRILAEPLDDHVAEALLDALDSPALDKLKRAAGRSESRVADLTRSLRKDEAAVDRLTNDHYVDARIGRREFLAAHDKLTERIGDSQCQLASVSAGRTLAALPRAGAQLRKQWEIADLEWRRALVEAVLERIDVGPSRARGQSDLSRVSVRFRTD